MLIVCPNCATSYQVQATALGAEGRSVRCAQCKNTWHATMESMVAEPAMLPVPVVATPSARAADDFVTTAHDVSFERITPSDDVYDAAAPTIIDAPPLVPDNPFATPPEAAHKFEPGVAGTVESAAARRVRNAALERKNRRTLLQQLLSLPLLIAVMLIIVLSALNWRVQMVRYFPQTASLYAAIGLPVNLRGLFFDEVKSRTEFHDGVNVLVIEGTIVNLTTRTLDVPRLRLSLRNAAGHEVYAWTALAGKTTLGSGNGLPFRARLASPPPDGRDVIVRFFSKRDVSTP